MPHECHRLQCHKIAGVEIETMKCVAGKQVKVEHTKGRPSFDLEFVPQPPHSVQLYVNGVRFGESGYEVEGKTVLLRMAIRSNDAVLVDYRY